MNGNGEKPSMESPFATKIKLFCAKFQKVIFFQKLIIIIKGKIPSTHLNIAELKTSLFNQ